MENTKFLRAKDVAEIMEVSTASAYNIIRKLNQQLSDQGYLTVAGRINKSYFLHKLEPGLSGPVLRDLR